MYKDTLANIANRFSGDHYPKICHHLGFKPGAFPSREEAHNCIGQYTRSLTERYLNGRVEKDSKDDPYCWVWHKDNAGKPIRTKVHDPKLHSITCHGFPAKFDDNIPEYNAQYISDKNDDEPKIIVGAGPQRNTIPHFFSSLEKNKVKKVLTLGTPAQSLNSHYDYYKNKESVDSIGLTSQVLSGPPVPELPTYQVTLYPDQKDKSYDIIVKNIPTPKNVLSLTIDQLKEIYEFAKDDDVFIHCYAGQKRSAILALALQLARKDCFNGKDEKQCADIILAACEKRPGLCTDEDVFKQALTYAMVFTAFKYGFEEIPEELFDENIVFYPPIKTAIISPRKDNDSAVVAPSVQDNKAMAVECKSDFYPVKPENPTKSELGNEKQSQKNQKPKHLLSKFAKNFTGCLSQKVHKHKKEKENQQPTAEVVSPPKLARC